MNIKRSFLEMVYDRSSIAAKSTQALREEWKLYPSPDA